MIEKIDTSLLKTEGDYVYYYWQKIRLQTYRHRGWFDYSIMDRCIDYYERHDDNARLSEAYYLKSMMKKEDNDLRGAILFLKKAEKASSRDDNGLSFPIYEALCAFNEDADEHEDAIKYGKKAIASAAKYRDTDPTVMATIHLIRAYRSLGYIDSALACAEKIEPILDKHPYWLREHYYLVQLAALYYPIDKEKAQNFLDKAKEYQAYEVMMPVVGQIYFDAGEYGKAEKYFLENIDPVYPDATIPAMEGIIKIKCAEGKYREADSWTARLMEFKDSVAADRKQKKIREMQTVFDMKTEEEKQSNKFFVAIWAISALAILTLLIYTYYILYATRKAKRRLKEGDKRLSDAKKRITADGERMKEMNAAARSRAREIEELKTKVETIKDSNTGSIVNGKRLAAEIDGGGTTVRWTKTDFADFIAYCKVEDGNFIAHLENDFDKLSDKHKFFAIMKHAGTDDKRLAEMMAVSQSTLRSIKSRINAKKI